MSDTPKTDWAETNEQGERTGYVRASFCRQLERELAAARENCTDLTNTLEQTRRELAEAHKRIAYLEAITTGAEHKAIDKLLKEKP